MAPLGEEAHLRTPRLEFQASPVLPQGLPGLTEVETEAELSSAWQFVLKLKPELADPRGNIKQVSSRVPFIFLYVTKAL